MDMIEEAIECLLEGSAATKPCTGSWAESADKRHLMPEQVYNMSDEVESTCVEGALIIGAKMRGHTFDMAMDLIQALDIAASPNDEISALQVNDAEGRDAAVAFAKELRK